MTAVIAGFYGKLPARGDFVRGALPRDFTDRWDAWLAPAIAGSRTRMGEDWLPAFWKPRSGASPSPPGCAAARRAGPDAAQRGPCRPLFPADLRRLVRRRHRPSETTRHGWIAAKPPAAPPWNRMPVRTNSARCSACRNAGRRSEAKRKPGRCRASGGLTGRRACRRRALFYRGCRMPRVYATMLGAEADGNARPARLPQEPITDQPPTADKITVPDAPTGGDAWESPS